MPSLPSPITRGRREAPDLGDNTRGEMSRGMLLMFKATLKLLRWQNRQQKGIKPRFRFGSVLLKNRGFGTDFDNRNNTSYVYRRQGQGNRKRQK